MTAAAVRANAEVSRVDDARRFVVCIKPLGVRKELVQTGGRLRRKLPCGTPHWPTVFATNYGVLQPTRSNDPGRRLGCLLPADSHEPPRSLCRGAGIRLRRFGVDGRKVLIDVVGGVHLQASSVDALYGHFMN